MTPLHIIGDWLREVAMTVPLWAVRCMFVALPVLLLVWVLRLPASRTTATGNAGWDRNLKVGATIALVMQIVIYLLL